MKKRHRAGPVGLVALVLVACLPDPCNSDTRSTTQTLAAQINPIGKLSVAASLPLASAATTFVAYSGSLPVSYRVRTTAGGGGSITVQATSDFSPSGGPSISTGVLTYTCGGATLGSSCSGIQTVSTTAQTPVLAIPGGVCTGGGGVCSTTDPNSVSVNFALSDDPQYNTGTFSASLTFTISAT